AAGGWFTGTTFVTSWYTHALATSYLEGCSFSTAAVSTPANDMGKCQPTPNPCMRGKGWRRVAEVTPCARTSARAVAFWRARYTCMHEVMSYYMQCICCTLQARATWWFAVPLPL
ncbi:hypothetical protein COO60DRAFT_1267803, partial [Scenedesmus sp. NREL 46B-D3]